MTIQQIQEVLYRSKTVVDFVGEDPSAGRNRVKLTRVGEVDPAHFMTEIKEAGFRPVGYCVGNGQTTVWIKL